MKDFGNKLAQKRKERGLTQNDFADQMHVTRQTVGRWETGQVLPDIDKVPDIANALGVSCDYLLQDDIMEENETYSQPISPLLRSVVGKTVRLDFFEEQADIDLYNQDVTILAFEGNWLRAQAVTKKGQIEKLIPLSSVLSITFVAQEEQ